MENSTMSMTPSGDAKKNDEVKNAITELIFQLTEAGIYILNEDVSPEGYHSVAKAAKKVDGLLFDYKEWV